MRCMLSWKMIKCCTVLPPGALYRKLQEHIVNFSLSYTLKFNNQWYLLLLKTRQICLVVGCRKVCGDCNKKSDLL